MASTVKRQSAAVMFTDIAGYTSIMASDEEKALSLLQDKRKILKPLIKQHDGVYVKGTGDGTLSYFDSAYNASKCAKLFQESIYDNKNMNVRVGIHVGDIVFDDGDVYGDGVNVASRLESMSPVGGICVSNTVYDELRNKKDFDGVELGLQSLKGVGRLIEIYGLKGDLLTEPKPSDYQDNKVAVHSDDEVPSIAIIPFDNKGADEDVFYAYGISADLISDVSSAGLIRVASKKDIEKLDYTNLDNTELSQKLLVRYIANGELWRMGDMFQLSVELYDTKDKKVVWSDRWQEKWDNLPTIKGSLSDGLLKALDTKPKVEQKIETTNPEAYEFYLKAKHKDDKCENMDDIEIVRGLFKKAIELDDKLILAKTLLGHTYIRTGDNDKALDIFQPTLMQAEELADKQAISAVLSGFQRIHYIEGQYEQALEIIKRMLTIYEQIDNIEGVGGCFSGLGAIYYDTGDYNKSLDYYKRSIKIAEKLELIKLLGSGLHNTAVINNSIGNYDKALNDSLRTITLYEKIDNIAQSGSTLQVVADSYNKMGEYEKAMEYAKRGKDILEKLNNKRMLGYTLLTQASIYKNKAENKIAIKCLIQAENIFDEINEQRGLGLTHSSIGNIYYNVGKYNKAITYLKKSLTLQNNIGLNEGEILLRTTTNLFLINKIYGKKYDEEEFITLISKTPYITFELNLRLYELLEDKSYLESAYNQIQKISDNLGPDVAAKFLSYPIPKAIVEEWEKVK